MDISKKCIVVTGGARGLGRAIVENLLGQGAYVVVLDSDHAALASIPRRPELLLLCCDVTNATEVEQSLDSILRSFPKIHALINNAGILHSEPLISLTSAKRRHSLDTWRAVLDTNLTGPFIVTCFLAEHMVMSRVRGVVVNISSISAQGNAGQSAYSAAKAGLESMTKVWAKELGGFNIRCLAVAPGYIETHSTRTSLDPGRIEMIKGAVPLKRFGSIDNVVQVVCLALTNDYLNATVLSVDGGLKI
jgi:3-oxoacyl-[acyl-carrier protein] reductase